MRLRLALGMVGGLIGADFGLLFGVIPAGALTYSVLEDFLRSSGPVSEEAAFVVLWGAFTSMNAAIGVAVGVVIERTRRSGDGAYIPDPRLESFRHEGGIRNHEPAALPR